MKIIFISLVCLSIICNRIPLNAGNASKGSDDQIRQIAIQDFSKTKLFKMDSIFDVTLYDTVHKVEQQRIDEHNVKSVIGKVYHAIIAVNIVATPFKFLFDTTAKMEVQNGGIPTRVFEKDGRLFLWRDRHYPLSDSTLKVLNKFHLVERGTKKDLNKFLIFGIDDAKRGADYYFCRNNLSNYKRVITNKAIGYYDPTNITCK